MEIFRFRKFEVRNERSAMKVNTDGVLLGAIMHMDGSERRLLDIGTGTGTIALMAAQRLSEAAIKQKNGNTVPQNDGNTPSSCPTTSVPDSLTIDAIDIDAPSAEEAALNFDASPWSPRLRAFHSALSDFRPDGEYDLIFSNPPFFTETLHSPSERKARSRHADALPLEEIISFAAEHLSPLGRLALILPASREKETAELALRNGLHTSHITEIHGSDRKPAYRVIMEISRRAGQNGEPLRERVTINMNGKYSEQYLKIVSDFLLI